MVILKHPEISWSVFCGVVVRRDCHMQIEALQTFTLWNNHIVHWLSLLLSKLCIIALSIFIQCMCHVKMTRQFIIRYRTLEYLGKLFILYLCMTWIVWKGSTSVYEMLYSVHRNDTTDAWIHGTWQSPWACSISFTYTWWIDTDVTRQISFKGFWYFKIP